MPVCQAAYLHSCQRDLLVDGIDDDEVIAEAVHLGEFKGHELHRAMLLEKNPAPGREGARCGDVCLPSPTLQA